MIYFMNHKLSMAVNKCCVGAVCAGDKDLDESTLISCSGDNCSVTVHPVCYGLPEETTSFTCEKCEANVEPECALCPARDGAFKRTTSGEWVHILCATYVPGSKFENGEKLSGVNMENIDRTHPKPCSICKSDKGVCISCGADGCKTMFHVTCAQQHGLLIFNAEEAEDPLYALCASHHPDKKKNTEVSAPDSHTNTKSRQDSGKSTDKHSSTNGTTLKPSVVKSEAKSASSKEKQSDDRYKSRKEKEQEKEKVKEKDSEVKKMKEKERDNQKEREKEKLKEKKEKSDAKEKEPKKEMSSESRDKLNSKEKDKESLKRETSGAVKREHEGSSAQHADKKRRISSGSVITRTESRPLKEPVDTQTAIDEFMQKHTSDLRALLTSRLAGNMDAVVHLAPEISKLQESNKELQKRIKALEAQRNDLRLAKDKLYHKKDNKQASEKRTVNDNLLRGCLLTFGVFAPQSAKDIESVKDHEALIKLVSQKLTEVKADGISAAEKEQIFKKIVSEAATQLNSNTSK